VGWTAVVLAGARASGDAVAEHCGVPVKAMAEVGGEAMLVRVLRALAGVEAIKEVLIVGDEELLAPLLSEIEPALPHRVIAPRSSPATSLSHAFKEISHDRKVLVTTSDHALLRGEWVAEFIDAAEASNNEMCLGLASATDVRRVLPSSTRTILKFSDISVCTCNLFAFCNRQARRMSDEWAAQEGMRKSPLRLLRRLGVGNAALYGLGRLDMKGAFRRLSLRFGVDIGTILMPHPLLAVDVDTPDDLALCRRLVAEGKA